MSQIKNIIFDLGGVIFNIDYHKTSNAFKQLGISNFDKYYSQASQIALFSELEIGKISEAEFRAGLRQLFNCELNDDQINEAWSAMLLDLPIERINYLIELGKRFKLYLFSNINSIHMRHVYKEFSQLKLPVQTFESLFNACYYSHLFGMRKPNPQAFLEILKQNKLQAEETVFIDDSIQHIKGAEIAGLHTLHFKPSLDFLRLEDEYIPQLLNSNNLKKEPMHLELVNDECCS